MRKTKTSTVGKRIDMTFSQNTKNEILRSVRNLKDCCQEAFLYGAVKSCGSLSFGTGKISVALDSENVNFLRLCGEISEKLFAASCKIEHGDVSAKGTAVYTANLEGNVAECLGITYLDEEGVLHINEEWDKQRLSVPCCKRAFFQALFIACGSVVIPQTEDDLSESKSAARYHLELRFADEVFCNGVDCEAREFGFRKTMRKNRFVLYIKDSEKIADFLVYINAMAAKLKLENVIIGRSLRNAANRQSNCISANIDKTVAASEKQLTAIARLRAEGRLDSLPQTLIDAANMRERFPEATIEEIAVKLGISKSGASHRLGKLVDICG